MKHLIIIITSLFMMISLSYADYHYASHTGSNQYPYTSWETAADSIQAAMLAASPYDTVYIGPGDYNEVIDAPRQDTCLTFIGAGIDSTRIWQDSVPNTWMARDKTFVRDIFFDLDNMRGCFGGYSDASIIAIHCKFRGLNGILGEGDSTIVENCEFYDVWNAVYLLYTRKFMFRNNYIKTSAGYAIIMHSWYWGIIENNIFISTSHDPFFNEVTDRTDSTIFRNNYLDHMLEGFDVSGPISAVVDNNTNRESGRTDIWPLKGIIVWYLSGESGDVALRNNAITESGSGIYAMTGDTALTNSDIHYNGLWGNYQNFVVSNWANVDTMGNINAFPMYANPDSFDVHLQAYSPYIDAGDPSILDVDGTRSDIGVFGGPGGSRYEYQDLPPKKPDSLSYSLSDDSLIIRWRMNYEADFWRYMINRDTVPNFTPWAGNIVGEPDTSLFVDLSWDSLHNYYYKIVAYDRQGNLSLYSNELFVPITGINDNSGVDIPNITLIESNYPNPFNSSTIIVYTVANLGPIPAQINIDIYDIQGRKVKSLLNKREEAGKHRIAWDGRDDRGLELASGIYFAKITQWHVDYLSHSQKLVLVR